MKLYIVILSMASVFSFNIFAQTEWNKEIQVDRRSEGLEQTKSISNLSGIGAVINKVDGNCIIFEILKESGAAAAGLKESDIIKSIDSKDISSLDLLEIASLLRGAPGTKVVLSIQRGGEAKTQDFIVVRQPVKLR